MDIQRIVNGYWGFVSIDDLDSSNDGGSQSNLLPSFGHPQTVARAAFN